MEVFLEAEKHSMLGKRGISLEGKDRGSKHCVPGSRNKKLEAKASRSVMGRWGQLRPGSKQGSNTKSPESHFGFNPI